MSHIALASTTARLFRAVGIVSLFTLASYGTEFYVSPTGSPSGNGSSGSPWDLGTALAPAAAIKPGDTIWLRGGTYSGIFTSNLNGSASAPIVVRQYPGERAILDGGSNSLFSRIMTINGSNTWYWGFEVMSSATQRTTGQTGSGPTDLNSPTGFYILGNSNRFINLIVHDTSQSFGFWSSTNNVMSEIYGTLIYYNGWDAPDRGHGHGIYGQNQTGVKRIVDNIIFNQFGLGIQVYGSGAAFLNNFVIDGNTIFDNTLMSAVNHDGYEILLGGGSVAQSPTITNNYTYQGLTGGSNAIGYDSGCANGVVQNNYFGGGLMRWNCTNTTVSGNTFYGTQQFSPSTYPSNTYYTTTPTQSKIFIRPNQYEPGRANITIYNWTAAQSVTVDLSTAGLPVGSTFQIRDAQNFFGAPVASGTYTGAPVQIPMTGTTVTIPQGNVPSIPQHTPSVFGAFVLLPASTAPVPTVTPVFSNVQASSVSFNSATITWMTDIASDSQVEYGQTGSYGALTPLDSTSVTSHSANLIGLLPSTQYHFRLRSKGSTGQLGVSGDYTFTTAAAPTPQGQNIALNKPAQQSSTSQWSKPNDAQGGDNGVKNGSFGFCTNLEANPWWQVDLLQPMTLNEVRLFNRLDSNPERSRTAKVLLSFDGTQWQLAFTNPGTIFGGTDGKPLIVSLLGAQARYVRVQVAETTYLHLDEIEIYGSAGAVPAPPVITSVNVPSASVTASGATITWITSTASDSQVDFGTTTGYGTSTAVDTALVTSHSVNLTGLAANTLYHFRVKSKDSLGQLSSSNDFTLTTATGPTPPPNQNLALNKPAQQSSTSQWSKPNDAQGGDNGVKNGSFGFCTNFEANPWWQVDLQQVSIISEVRVYNRLDWNPERARTIRVLLSNDGANWQQVYANPGTIFGGVDGNPLKVTLSSLQARYVRLQLNESNYLHLDEVEVYGSVATPAPGTNIARNKPAQQSSVSAWSKPNDALGGDDGVKNGSFGFCTNLEVKPWWQVDLQQMTPINEVRVFNRLDWNPERARTVQVLVSSDGTNWQLMYSNPGTIFGGVDGNPLHVMLNGVQARYIRLQLTETNYLHLDEVEVY